MGAIKRAFHDEICWNALDDDERADVLNPLSASRKADREMLANAFTDIATRHGASVERRHTQRARGYCGQGIDLTIACKGVGAHIGISDLHGGEWVLISWFNDEYPARNFSASFGTAVGAMCTWTPHHKATSHPRNWHSLAKMLDAGLSHAARGEAFEERSAT